MQHFGFITNFELGEEKIFDIVWGFFWFLRKCFTNINNQYSTFHITRPL